MRRHSLQDCLSDSKRALKHRIGAAGLESRLDCSILGAVTAQLRRQRLPSTAGSGALCFSLAPSKSCGAGQLSAIKSSIS